MILLENWLIFPQCRRSVSIAFDNRQKSRNTRRTTHESCCYGFVRNRIENVEKKLVPIIRLSGAKQYCPRAEVCLKISTGKDKTGVSIYRGVSDQCFSSWCILKGKLDPFKFSIGVITAWHTSSPKRIYFVIELYKQFFNIRSAGIKR